MNTIKFSSSLLTPYLRSEIKQEHHFIKFKIPNTFLFFIPCGSKTESIPIEQISTVSANANLSFGMILLGLLAGFMGYVMMSMLFTFGLILFIVGILNIFCAFQAKLTIETTSGKSWVINFLIFEKGKAVQAAEQIEQLISRRYDATDVGLHTAKQTEISEQQTNAIVNAISNINKNN